MRIYRNRKGVSTVIGTVLMIMVVMVGMSILFSVMIVYADNFQQGSGRSVLESITVEDVHFINPNTVQLSLYNTGKTDLEVSNVYIEGRMATLPAGTVSIAEGEHCDGLSVTAPSGITFTGDQSYSFKVVTLRGSGFEGTYIYG
jgi:FlaG/FlaF family flagellin (archaellin)